MRIVDLFEGASSSNDCYFIAEIGLNHNGDIQIAKKLIDSAYRAGADAVKFQKRTVDQLAIKSVLDAKDDRFPNFGSTYREIRQFLEFNITEYQELKLYSENLDLEFLVTPFDLQALKFLQPLELSGYKLASHSVTNLDLVEAVAHLGKPIIMSTGMSHLDEIATAVNVILSVNKNLSLLHCVSSYPTPDRDCNLNVIPFLRERFNLPIGYSGHEKGWLPTLLAVQIGARIVERHITLDTQMEGFDHKLSLDPNDLKELISHIRSLNTIMGTKEKKFLPVETLARDKYNVSMVSTRELSVGDILTLNDICWKNPGTGIPRKKIQDFLGKKLVVSVGIDELLRPEMFE
jgi:sialic acid synthase SpsE